MPAGAPTRRDRFLRIVHVSKSSTTDATGKGGLFSLGGSYATGNGAFFSLGGSSFDATGKGWLLSLGRKI